MGDKRRGKAKHHPLRKLATRQHGVISTRQLARIGYTRSSASKAHGVGRLTRVYRGVYAVGHTELSWKGWCTAAVLANWPGLASHSAAGRVWGLLGYEPERIHLTVPTWRRLKRGFVLHFAVVPAAEIAVEDAIPLTSVGRTKLDLAAELPLPRLERLLERSEELGLLDLDELRGVLGRHPRHPGSGQLARLLDIYRDEPVVLRSSLEREFLNLVVDAGLPAPAMNRTVGGMELDAYWERERLAVELDVYETHGTHVAFERDRIRGDDLLALGVETIRITGARLRREPDEVMRRLGQHLSRRRHELS